MTASYHIYDSLLNSLDSFNSFLQTGDESQLKSDLNKRPKHFKRDFCLITIGSDAHIEGKLNALFTTLGIPSHQWPVYYDPKLSVLHFLKLLQKYNQNTNRLAELIRQIEEKLSFSFRQWALIAVSAIIITLCIVFIPPIQEFFLSVALDLTIVGLVYSSISALYKLRLIYYEDWNKSLKEKFQDLTFLKDAAFLLTATVLNVSAYALWMTNGGIMSPLVAGVFITSSVIEVVKETYQVILNSYYFHQSKRSTQNFTEYNICHEKSHYEYLRHFKAALINLAAALIIASLITTWCFIPGNTPTTIGMVAAMLLVQIIKSCLNYCNRKDNEKQRMEILSRLKGPDVTTPTNAQTLYQTLNHQNTATPEDRAIELATPPPYQPVRQTNNPTSIAPSTVPSPT